MPGILKIHFQSWLAIRRQEGCEAEVRMCTNACSISNNCENPINECPSITLSTGVLKMLTLDFALDSAESGKELWRCLTLHC